MYQSIVFSCFVIFISTISFTESMPGSICTYHEDVSKAKLCPGKTIYVETQQCSISKSQLKNIIKEIIAKKSAATSKQLKNLKDKFKAIDTKCENFRRTSSKNCYELANLGVRTSGLYNITIGKKITEVYCDMDTDGGGWLVIQRRLSNLTNFYLDWFSYQIGFGNLSGNFWLGLNAIHAMTSSQSYQLRVDLEDFSGNQAYAVYRFFSIGNESTNYRLHISGYEQKSTAGDALSYSNGRSFSTKDRDNDGNGAHCAVLRHGAWWYYGCTYSNLNGKYFSTGVKNDQAMTWVQWKHESLKRVEMKIKPN